MEEILKNIESEINFIKEKQEELKVLTNNSQEVQDELKKLDEERETISDKESGFYKDLSEKFDQKDKEFREANIKRMNKDKEINKLISEKKEAILKDLESKKQYIDDNRNVDLQGLNLKELESEKEKLEKEIKLNDITKEEFEKMSDSEKQEVRKAKENYLNNKHRLDEITPTIDLMETLDGKTPREKFLDIENIEKQIEANFNGENLDNVIPSIDEEYAKLIEKNKESEKDWYEPKGFEESLNETQREEQEAKNAQMSKEEFARAYNSNYKGQVYGQSQIQGQGQGHTQVQSQTSKHEIVLDISNNKINVNGNDIFYYKEETKNKKDIVEKYAIDSKFLNDKKARKNIDYALISTLGKIDDKDGSLVEAYLKVIREGNTQSEEVKESIEKLNKAVDIEYKFNKENSILTNLRERRLARNARKLGIAYLDGISEKSFTDKIKETFSKIKNTKLLKGKDKPKALESGKNSRAQEQKLKTIDLINRDREQSGIRDRVKVENKDNIIEKAAKEAQKETEKQIGKDVQDIKKQEEEQK